MSNITSREQIIVLVAVGVILAGLYGFFRYMPQHKVINALGQKLEKTIQHVKNPKYPQVPDEDVEDLEIEAEYLTQTLANLRAQVDNFAQNLAPTDNQDVLLKISGIARTTGVKVIESIPYIVSRRVEVTAAPKKKLKKRAQRKLRKAQRKKAILNQKFGRTNQSFGSGSTVGAIPKEGELIDRLVNSMDEARPMQRVSVEGSFANLQQFIQSLQSMSWQITIVKLDISVNIQTPPQGMPQPILARMIIAM